MGTTLHMLTNAKIACNESEQNINKIMQKLKDLNLETTYRVGPNNTTIKETGDWEYFVEEEKNASYYTPYNVSFEGPFSCTPTLYTNIGIIWTMYRYSFIYQYKEIAWFSNFREEAYKVVKAIGGTEIIYVADNACDKLATYLECMAWENIPYNTIKEEMIKEFGNPVTDYKKLDFNKLDYKHITEFFLDDFSDLK